MAFKLPPVAERAAFLRQAAMEEGIDPKVALYVARREGLREGVYQSRAQARYGQELSFGDLQIHDPPQGSGYDPGVGTAFRKATGLDPSDPRNWKEVDRYALKWAKKHGWGDWSGARGLDRWAGIKRVAGTKPNETEFESGVPTSADGGDDVEGMPDLDEYPVEEADADQEEMTPVGRASVQLSEAGEQMMANNSAADFDYTPAGPNMDVDYTPTEGIPMDAYADILAEAEPQMYADEGGEVDFDPSAHEFSDEEIDPSEFFRNFG